MLKSSYSFIERISRYFFGFQLAEKEEFEHQQKELEKICMPIITKVYQAAGAGGMPEGMAGGMPGGMPGSGAAPGGGSGSGGPTIEEVD